MLITCLQLLPYQGLNLPTLERYAAKEGEKREDAKKSFPGRKHYTSKITEMVALPEILLTLDFMPRCCYFPQNQKKIEQVNQGKAKAYSFHPETIQCKI